MTDTHFIIMFYCFIYCDAPESVIARFLPPCGCVGADAV